MQATKDRVVLAVLILVIGAGALLIGLSLSTYLHPGTTAKGFRALGFAVLSIGLGEWLNHPLQKKQLLDSPEQTESFTVHHRRRNPCGLGNLFDVIGLLAFFVALSLFFFPYEN